jgi:hypothetical protein
VKILASIIKSRNIKEKGASLFIIEIDAETTVAMVYAIILLILIVTAFLLILLIASGLGDKPKDLLVYIK